MRRYHPKPSDIERVAKQISEEVQDQTERFMKTRCSKPTDLELVTERRKEMMDQMRKESEESDAAQELWKDDNHKEFTKLVNAEEEKFKRVEEDFKRRRINMFGRIPELAAMEPQLPAVEPITVLLATCYMNSRKTLN